MDDIVFDALAAGRMLRPAGVENRQAEAIAAMTGLVSIAALLGMFR